MPCNRKTEVYSRIVGYYRPVQQWNPGKKAEFRNRKNYKITVPSPKKDLISVHTALEPITTTA